MKVRHFERVPALLLVSLLSTGTLCWMAPDASAETLARRASAAESVREALQREIYGLAEDRQRLLSEAAQRDPRLDAAKWHSGMVQDDLGRWVDHQQYVPPAAIATRLAEYRKLRDTHQDTIDDQLTLANWCAERNLPNQERAHLTRVVDLSPDHIAARARLGFVRSQGAWVSRDEIASEQTRQLQRQQDLETWRPVVQDILKDLRHRSADRKRVGTERLMQVHDPAAIPAMDELLSTAGENEERLVVDALAQMTDPAASVALARHAVLSQSLAVREAASRKLSAREFDTFMPQLLGMLYSPVVSRMTVTTLPGGRLGYRHEFLREGQQQRELLMLDTEYQRVALAGGSRRDSALRARADVARDARQREQAVQVQNQLTQQVNERVMWVLSLATNESLAADPAAWWKWWNDRNEVFVQGEKAVATVQQTQQVSIVDRVPQSSGGSSSGSGSSSASSSGGSQSLDCLAAGTTVWTADGAVAVELVRIGDLVLAQHAETGELAYKPVLKTTIRPRGQLIRIQIDGAELQTSGGHLFWVSGEGWVKSRNLQPGMVLHGVNGLARVQAIDKGEMAETYNLVVADFNTYFVGPTKVLSHDNTVRLPTRATVPGLRIE